MLRVAWRSLMTRPIRAAVLAAGFGFGIAVMVELLGVGQVILEQAHAPALSGGGDLVVSGPFGPVSSARHVIATLGRASDLADRVTAISATRRGKLFLITPRRAIQISAIGGVPSLEKSIGDPEVSAVAAWTDAPGDVRWSRPTAGDVLRAMDRFHPIPQATQSSSSWAEWLYFNGRTPDGRIRVYLTFLVGPPAATAGRRQAGVRLQLEHEGRATTYRASGEVDEASVLASAPDLEIAGNRVRLEGATYRISLALSGRADSAESPQLRAVVVARVFGGLSILRASSVSPSFASLLGIAVPGRPDVPPMPIPLIMPIPGRPILGVSTTVIFFNCACGPNSSDGIAISYCAAP